MSGDRLPDFTRWNRAGLRRVRYVEGDAANRLDDLRRAHLAQYLRGADDLFRDPAFWSRLFEAAPDERPDAATRADLLRALQWKSLWRSFPEEPESASARAARLREEYLTPPGEPTAEIARVFARALHILLGHLDAYANEGFIRTATQWDNTRRLAATVGYVPAPPASATTEVALIARSTGPAMVERGLAMRWKPPAGTPIVFETLKDLVVHPDLNAARAQGCDRNETALQPGRPLRFETGDVEIAPGDVVVLAPPAGSKGPAQGAIVRAVAATEKAGVTEITFDREIAPKTWTKVGATLLVGPAGPRRARLRKRAAPGGVTVDMGGAVRLAAGDVVAWTGAGEDEFALVEAVEGTRAVLSRAPTADGMARLSLLGRIGRAAGLNAFRTPASITRLVAVAADGSITVREGEAVNVQTPGGEPETIARHFDAAELGNVAFLPPEAGAPTIHVTLIGDPPPIGMGFGDAARTLEFEGTPPSGLQAGAWLAARGGGETIDALQVAGVRVEQDRHYVAVASEPPADALYYGPFAAILRYQHWNRAPDPLVGVDGRVVVLAGLAPEARALVKPGRRVLLEDERTEAVPPALAGVVAVSPGARGSLTVKLESEAALSTFAAGWTALRLNVVAASHGETRGPKTLGSGDAERPRQSFTLDEPDLAFVPDPTAPTGVRADLDVAVDGVLWHQVAPEETVPPGDDAYHLARRETGGYDVVFRWRLPTGRDNVSVRRRRVGVGPVGNGVPALGFSEPVKPHPAIALIRQPVPPAGGAGPEPVERIREAAPAHLKALDRAVSIADYATLAKRHAKVQAARATRRVVPGREDVVAITMVPVGGGGLTQSLRDELTAFLAVRGLPGVRPELDLFQSVPVAIAATIRVDAARHDPDDVREAALAVLATRFGLTERGLGQALFSAEILGALETVRGVETAIATLDLAEGAPDPRRTSPTGEGPYRALYAAPDQVIHLARVADAAVSVETV